MTDLIIEETSGVDHPAHLHEGWIVAKAATVSTAAEVMESLPDPVEESMADEITPDPDVEVPGDEAGVEPVTEASDTGEVSAEDQEAQDALAVAEARIAELEARIAELEASTAEKSAEESPADTPEPVVEESGEDALLKAAPPEVREMIVKARQEREEALATLTKEREERADEAAIAKAATQFEHLNVDPSKIGPALRRLAGTDPDLAKSLEDALLAADAQQESAGIFAEIGKSAGAGAGTDAYSKMQSLAKAKVAAGDADTVEKALTQVVSENPDLYEDYLSEKGA
jgi:hypothetical protein